MSELPGLDLDRVTTWLDAVRPGLRRGPLTGEVIAGGRSNLTYRITDGEQVWALRRPPLAHVLPTAHDMAREHRVISALGPTAVPVPTAVALCEDVDVIGAPFYVMTFVDGELLDDQAAADALDPAAARRTGELLVDTLIALHSVVPDAVGLADFGRPAGYLERQLRRWKQQWDASVTRELPVMDDLMADLTATRPESGSPTIVHGDFRLTNVLLGPAERSVAAVLDWEMATLGDPLTDVGLLVIYHRLAGGPNNLMPIMRADRGFLTGDQLGSLYSERSGRALLPWYVAFGYFKLAVIAEGIRARYQQGMTVGEGFDTMGDDVPELLQAARDELRR